MLFLVDENLPISVGKIFSNRGYEVEYVSLSEELRSQPDEVIFNYAVAKRAIIVTRDLNFGNPTRFPLNKIPGIIVLRFPNEISIKTLVGEAQRLLIDFREESFNNLIIIEPGSVRARPFTS